MRKYIIPALIFILSFQDCFSQSNFCFAPASYTHLSNNYLPVYKMCSGDFNSDGYNDIVNVDSYYSHVYVHLSDGNNGFHPVNTFTNFASASTFYDVESADFNSDARADLVITDHTHGEVGLLLGDGNGNFAPVINFPVGIAPNELAINDFNNDGKYDLAVSNFSSNTISILSGNGAGSFSLTGTYTVGANPLTVVCNDFNNDGKMDLATTNGISITLLKGNNNGTFILSNSINTGFSSSPGIAAPCPMITLDINNDNKQDIVGATSDGKITIIKGYGNFTFAGVQYTLSKPVSALSHGDFNNDGKQDLVFAYQDPYANVSVLPNIGSGLFGTPISYSISVSGGMSFPFSILVVDINNDNKEDFVNCFYNTSDMPVFVNCNTVDVGFEDIIANKNSICIYPNPANNILTLKFEQEAVNDLKTFIIYNQLGEKIKEQELIIENKTIQINTSTFANGFYTVQLKSETGEAFSKRFIVTH